MEFVSKTIKVCRNDASMYGIVTRKHKPTARKHLDDWFEHEASERNEDGTVVENRSVYALIRTIAFSGALRISLEPLRNLYENLGPLRTP